MARARLCAWLLLAAAPVGAAADPAYVGSPDCAECHLEAVEAWRGSDHAQAWTLPDEATVLGDFSGVVFDHGGQTSRFLRDGESYLIETEGPDGVRRAYPVVGVAGVDPLQQYLLSPAPGRVQAYDIAWDVKAARWYPVFAGQTPAPGDGFHWTGPYKNWDSRCAECHATGYSRNYDSSGDRYAPQMAEIGVGCEACHGPASAHVAWARGGAAPAGLTPMAPGLTPMALTIDLGASQQTEVMQCLACHSRREAMQDGLPTPGGDWHDAFSLTLLRDGVYHPDGSILDEAFEGGSFLQSKMNAQGVRCSTCHEPHSARLRAEGDAVCAQCHSPTGNTEFPTLTLKVYDDPSHHFHAQDSAGARCVSCHMISRTFMGADARRDHSFRVPSPDLAATGSPDACTDCHADRGADWAAAELARRFPDSAHRGPHHATSFAAARRDPGHQAPLLLDIAARAASPGVVRATALDLLSGVADAGAASRVTPLLADPDPLVRAAAAGALRGLPPDERLARLTPLLSDERRSVREAAAKALADAAPPPGAPGAEALGAARREWWAALMLRADFPETHLQIAGVALQAREFAFALSAFEQAVALDPQLVEAWSMIIRLNAAMGDWAAAQDALERGLGANPGDKTLTVLAESR